MGWSSRHKWVSRANARDAWLTRVSDEQIVANLKACHLALTTRAHGFLTANDGAEKSGSIGLTSCSRRWRPRQHHSTQENFIGEQYAHISADYKKLAALLAQV